MAKLNEVRENVEKAILVGVLQKLGEVSAAQLTEYLDELEFLVDTAGAVTMARFTQSLDHPNPKTFVGTGKLEEIAQYIKTNGIDLVVFDDELTPSQLRNIEKEFDVKVLDRTNLILDIFAKRAQTAYAKTQVELAQYKYLLPRLSGLWTHLERQRGGIGLRGPGETEIETDRRVIRDKISRLKEQLGKIDMQMSTQRKNRGNLVRLALVGYTNVGKSTIMNLLSKSEVFAENKLFATLDTTVRKMVIRNLPFLLTDTVGFIRKLPHHLVESFKSTLDEVREADIILHVVDISHPNFQEQIDVVNATMAELIDEPKPTLVLFNKVDAFAHIQKEEDDLTPVKRENHSLDYYKKMWAESGECDAIFISAKEKINIDELKAKLYDMAYKIHAERFPFSNFLYQEFDEED